MIPQRLYPSGKPVGWLRTYFPTLILFMLRSGGANIFFRSFKTRPEAAEAPAGEGGRAEGLGGVRGERPVAAALGEDALPPADRTPRRRAQRAGPDAFASSVRGRRGAEAGPKGATPPR